MTLWSPNGKTPPVFSVNSPRVKRDAHTPPGDTHVLADERPTASDPAAKRSDRDIRQGGLRGAPDGKRGLLYDSGAEAATIGAVGQSPAAADMS